MEHYSNVIHKSLESVKWTYGYTVLPRIVSPVIFVILARMLMPSDFGLIAIASLAISLVETVRETGFSRAFIHSDEDEQVLFNTVFWMSLGMGICLYFIIFTTTPLIARFFSNMNAIPVIRIMGIQVILASLNTCHNSTLVKKLEYKKLFKINLLPTLAPFIVTIPLAYMGLGVWALVTGYLSASVLRTVFLWCAIPLRPTFNFDLPLSRRVFGFGLFCSLESLLGWFYIWGDKLIVGHFLDASKLGLYTMASAIATLVFTLLCAPLLISYPLLCQLKKDTERMRTVLYKLMHLVASVSLPVGAVIFFCASDSPYFLGKKWIGIEIPLAILAVTNSLSYIVTIIIPDAFRATGRADIMPKFQSAKLLYTLPVFIIGVKTGGLTGFCYAKLAAVAVSFVLFLVVGIKVLHLNWRRTVAVLYPKFAAALVLFAILSLVNNSFISDELVYVRIGTNVLLGFAVYLVVLFALDRNIFGDMIRLFRQIVAVRVN